MPELQPALRAPRDKQREMIPTALLYGMAALALSSLAVVSFAVFTDRPMSAPP